ncbi:hypothetical protein C2G38_2254520 [Gigaspora rosea]|uniref:Uncharacterized protein n=1 Tax=Gigaspora rosea TaxID=44941 RepID=A0A397U601_9GLOM|nr:hypothetical protein C2G38_2254520 [Gigaspora rosea]
MEVFKKACRCQILIVQIDICSIEVPTLFTENFDYEDIENDFVHGSNVEIDGAYIWDDEYSVVIGFNVTLEPYTKLMKHKKTSKSDNKEESNKNEGAYDSTLIGENGQGYIWSDEASDTDDEFGTKNIKVAGLDELSDFDESTTEEVSLKESFKEVSKTFERAFLDGHTILEQWRPLHGKLIHSRQNKIDTLYILQVVSFVKLFEEAEDSDDDD